MRFELNKKNAVILQFWKIVLQFIIDYKQQFIYLLKKKTIY